MWARSRQKGFHLPGGDGVAIMMAGGWAVLLILYRALDQPDDMGIQWGMFIAFAAAGALVAAGARLRAMHAPEPPNPAADDVDWVAPPPRERERTPDRRPRDATAVTELLRDRPAWEGEVPDPSRAETTHLPELPDPSEAPTHRRRAPTTRTRSGSGTTRPRARAGGSRRPVRRGCRRAPARGPRRRASRRA